MVRILFIGNSHTYVNDVPLTVKSFADNDGYECAVMMLAHGGWFLAQHAAEPDVWFEITNGGFDYVVLQEHSHPFAPEEKYATAVKTLCEMIHAAGAVPVIYATWARKTEPEVQAYMDGVNARIAEENHALLAPVGAYWQQYIQNHPDAEMYGTDGAHAAPEGSRFAASMIWARIHEDLTEKRLDRNRSFIKTVMEAAEEKERIIVTVDGRCASGKTTLTNEIAECLGAAVVHTDDYVIPKARKMADRLNVPGGNCDVTRLVKEVLEPFRNGETVMARRYSCSEDRILDGAALPESNILFVEGSYSNLPEIKTFADVRAFVTAKDSVRYARLERRESPEALERFKKMWIPLEEAYLDAYQLPDRDCVILNGDND